jgi:GT2 family glycosyltransferase
LNQDNFIEVFIINFNGESTILSTIDSLYKSEDVNISISVIDDCSTDNSVSLIQNYYPSIPIFKMSSNQKRANILRKKALEMASHEFVFMTDNDLQFDKRCLAEMFNLFQTDEKIAACTPRLMYWNEPQKVYLAGTKVHFIGAAISEDRDKIYENKDDKPSLNSGSGICLLRRKFAEKVGGFDENLMQGWGSDGEFYQRLLLAGYKCYYVPSAFALHEDKLNVIDRKYRVVGQTYNRWVFILSHYSATLIILLIPVFLNYKLLQISFTIVKGLFPQFLLGILLVIKNWGYIVKKRKFVQSLRVVSDKDILFAGDIYVAPALTKNNKFLKFCISLFSSSLNLYWRFIKIFIPNVILILLCF